MSNVGFSTLAIVPGLANFAPAINGGFRPATAELGASAGGLFGRTFGTFLRGAVGPLIVATVVIETVKFVKASVVSASDLEQSIGAIDTIFKGSAGQMHDWASTAATTVGLTKNEYNTLGALLGAQLKNGGTSMDQLGSKTNSLIATAADLSAQFGGSTSQAVEALSSALKGERDPIEKYGVSLNQAKIDAEAAALGFQKVGGTLSTEASQAATLALIMEQTADAHGAFGRETDTVAHKQQVLNAMWEDGKAKIGSLFLPAVSGLASVLIGVLGPALDGTVRFLSFTSAAVQLFFGYLSGKGADVNLGKAEGPLTAFASSILEIFDGVKAAVGPYMPAIAASLANLGSQIAKVLPLLSPFSLILRALIPVLPQIAALIASLAVRLGPLLGPILALAAANFAAVGAFMRDDFAATFPITSALLGVFAGALAAIVPAILPVVAAIIPLVATLISALMPALQAIIPIFGMAGQIIGALVPILVPIITAIADVLIPIIQALLPVVATAFGVITSVISAAVQIVQGVIDVVLGVFTGDWSRVWKGLGEIVGGVWSAVVSIVSGALAILYSASAAALKNIVSVWGGAWNTVSAFFVDSWAALVNSASAGLDGIFAFFRGLPATLLTGLSTFGTVLVEVGRNMVDGLLDGLKAFVGRIAEAFLAPMRAMVDATRGALGIHSPSTLLRELGEDVGAQVAGAYSWAAPQVRKGGLSGALAEVATHPREERRFRYDDHGVSNEDKVAKIARAHLILVDSASASRSVA
jgi:phage-related protein